MGRSKGVPGDASFAAGIRGIGRPLATPKQGRIAWGRQVYRTDKKSIGADSAAASQVAARGLEKK